MEEYMGPILILFFLWGVFVWRITKRFYAGKFDNSLHEMEEYYNDQLVGKDNEISEKEGQVRALKNAYGKLSSLQKEIDDSLSYLDALDAEVLLAEVKPHYDSSLSSDDLKNRLVLLRKDQDEMIRSGKAFIGKAPAKQVREYRAKQKQILRCFNTECDLVYSMVTTKNGDASRGKIHKAYELINKLFASYDCSLSTQYLAAKLDELNLLLASQVAIEEEKAQRKLIREQLAEEEKVRRELEKKEQAVQKEESQFQQEVSKLTGYLQHTKDDAEKQMYITKIQDLEKKLHDLENVKKDIANRSQNTRAGFVYIISNIGSFGPGIYKIGMTRRLEPMDRVAELSSASVPFKFDVHAMIFSDDAPALEAILHRTFADKRVNMANTHKEFFRVSLDEIKQVVLSNHNATVKFIDEPEALEYYQTLALQKNT